METEIVKVWYKNGNGTHKELAFEFGKNDLLSTRERSIIFRIIKNEYAQEIGAGDLLTDRERSLSDHPHPPSDLDLLKKYEISDVEFEINGDGIHQNLIV